MKSIFNKKENGQLPFIEYFVILSSDDKKRTIFAAIIQILLSLLDLVGVIAVGLLGALAITGLQSKSPGNRVQSALNILGISQFNYEKQIIVIGLLAVVVLIGRTIFSIIFTKKILLFMSRRAALISSELIAKLLAQSLVFIQKRTSQDTLYSLTRGVELIAVQVIATSIVMLADLSLLVVLTLGIFTIDSSTAIGTTIIFGLIGVSLYNFMHSKANKLGNLNSFFIIKSNEKIIEVLASYRETVVRNRRNYYAREIANLRYQYAENSADLNFLPYISKYIIETAIILGAVLLGAIQFALNDITHAVSTLSIFLAAGTRIAPAVLRLQQGLIQVRSALGQARPALELINELKNSPKLEISRDEVFTIHSGFSPEISVNNLTYTYPGSNLPALKAIDINIEKGHSIAIVGPSGAGKSTFVDAILGLLNPDSGTVQISSLNPIEAIKKWPGAISYVPQDTLIIAGTIKENICMGYPIENAPDELVMKALKIAQLEEFVNKLPNGLDTLVGERGANLSGGQKQRLGIARAMFTQPLLLVLDEATSSLDGETESNVSDAIKELKGDTTVLMIAHRLSTVQNADMVIYMQYGEIVAKGTFDEVRSQVENFDLQAKLMGL